MSRQEQFQKVIEFFEGELKTIRTGRATPEIVDGIMVDAYDTKQSLKAVASIATPDAKTIQIEPWDGAVVSAIEKALIEADLGMMPNVDGKIIRLNMPMMTDENRQQMVKKIKEKAEDSRVKIRRIREDDKKSIEAQDGIGDDDKRRELENLESDVKDSVSKIDELAQTKEDEVTTI
ncbi:ribosome recycling factor [Candidatus Uhrbacteria bacterium]|jgi:ribosome recycling factor|nr:ribosome recycling factor [Candidatus Uhrbacteria bacterium]MBT7716935.1 ribosome recycling factor [Candidatus Uhrbacteria bacterium]